MVRCSLILLVQVFELGCTNVKTANNLEGGRQGQQRTFLPKDLQLLQAHANQYLDQTGGSHHPDQVPIGWQNFGGYVFDPRTYGEWGGDNTQACYDGFQPSQRLQMYPSRLMSSADIGEQMGIPPAMNYRRDDYGWSYAQNSQTALSVKNADHWQNPQILSDQEPLRNVAGTWQATRGWAPADAELITPDVITGGMGTSLVEESASQQRGRTSPQSKPADQGEPRSRWWPFSGGGQMLRSAVNQDRRADLANFEPREERRQLNMEVGELMRDVQTMEDHLQKLESIQAHLGNSPDMALLEQQWSSPQHLTTPTPRASLSAVDNILLHAQMSNTVLWVLVALGIFTVILATCLLLGPKLVYIRTADT